MTQPLVIHEWCLLQPAVVWCCAASRLASSASSNLLASHVHVQLHGPDHKWEVAWDIFYLSTDLQHVPSQSATLGSHYWRVAQSLADHVSCTYSSLPFCTCYGAQLIWQPKYERRHYFSLKSLFDTFHYSDKVETFTWNFSGELCVMRLCIQYVKLLNLLELPLSFQYNNHQYVDSTLWCSALRKSFQVLYISECIFWTKLHFNTIMAS